MKNFAGTSILFLFTIIILLLSSEIVIRQFFHPVDYLLPSLEDDYILGHRILSNSGGHDEWGFRNYKRPSSADIVAIGDSQTYGISAISSQSWPAHLSKMSSQSIYNMALGGYGPLHYLHLLKSKALELKPKMIVMGLYFGNDFVDSFNLAYSNANWANFRNADIEFPSPPQANVAEKVEDNRFLGSFRNWMAHNSVAYRLITQTTLGDKVRNTEAALGNPGLVDLSFDNSRQLFTPQRRLKALNLASINVKEGVRISKQAISEMQKICASQNINFLVVLVPTKELVYSEKIKIRFKNRMTEAFESLVNNENEIRGDLSEFLSNQNINFVDTLPPLRESVLKGEALYPFNDGHPNGIGYSVIAREIYNRGIQRLKAH